MLINRKRFFARPGKAFPLVSPDGEYVAYLAFQENRVDICLLSRISNWENHAKVIFSSQNPSINFQWSYLEKTLLIFEQTISEGHSSLRVVDIETRQQREIVMELKGRLHLLDQSEKSPGNILLGANNRDPRWFDIFMVDVVNDQAELVYENNRFSGFLASDLKLRLAVADNGDGSNEYFVCEDDMQWRSLFIVDAANVQTTTPLCIDSNTGLLYLNDTRQHDTSSLTRMDISTSEVETLAVDEKSDVEDTLINPVTHRIDAICFNAARKHWQAINDEYHDDLIFLSESNDGDFSITSRDIKNTTWIVGYAHDDKPNQYVVYDRAHKVLIPLFWNITEFESLCLQKMEFFYCDSHHDNKAILSYYTMPNEAAKNTKTVPLVVLVHGGPWARDKWGYNPWHQWLANRGYAVLSVNYRGSTGFGKTFLNAGDREWGGKMIDDINDAVLAFIDKAPVDPTRIGVVGTSYGGYAALMLISRYQQRYQCGIDIFGPTNLVKMIESIPPQWQSQREMLVKRVGDPDTEAGRALLAAHSPVSYIDKLKSPILIIEGFQDPRVDRDGIREYVAALKEKTATPVIHLSFPDEGHNLSKEKNRLAFCSIAELFLERYLNGRSEPPVLEQLHEVEFLTGKEYITGPR